MIDFPKIVYQLDLPASLMGQTMEALKGEKSLVKVVDPAPAQFPAQGAIDRALETLKNAKKPLIRCEGVRKLEKVCLLGFTHGQGLA